MVDKNGKITLIDFGASKQTQGDDNAMTTTGLAYTPAYAPPELQFGKRDKLGPWSDMYSLGATMYNLLTAQTPPDAMDLMGGSAQFDFPDSTSAELRELIQSLMSFDINSRPQDVAQVKCLLDDNKTKKEVTQLQPTTAIDTEATVVNEYSKPKVQETGTTENDEDFKAPLLIWRLLAIFGVMVFLHLFYDTTEIGNDYHFIPNTWVAVSLIAVAVCAVVGISMIGDKPRKISQSLIDIGLVGIVAFFLYATFKSLQYSSDGYLHGFILLIHTALVGSACLFTAQITGMIGKGRDSSSWKRVVSAVAICFVAFHLVIMAMNVSMHNWFYFFY